MMIKKFKELSIGDQFKRFTSLDIFEKVTPVKKNSCCFANAKNLTNDQLVEVRPNEKVTLNEKHDSSI